MSKKVKHDLVPQGAPKLQDVKFWSFFFQIWHLVTFMYLEVQGRVLPFWKPLINVSKEPDCYGCWSALNVCQAMLKNCIHFSTLMHTTVHTSFSFILNERIIPIIWHTYYICAYIQKSIEYFMIYIHYGSFWQNLSKNSRNIDFAIIWHFFVFMALRDIKKSIKIEKGQWRS